MTYFEDVREYTLYGGVLSLTIYVDQMFLENFIMNYIILYAASKFSGVKSKWYRLGISAGIGAVYVIASYIFGFYNEQVFLFKVILAVVMVIVGFDIRNLREFLKAMAFFLGITFLIGGASFGLAFLFNFSMISEGGVLYVEEFPVLMIILGTTVSIIIIKWIVVFLKSRLNLEELLYDVEIKLFDKKILIKAFLDSGHNVKETITGYPVIIVEKSVLEKLVPSEIIEKIRNNDFEFDEKWKKRVRIIPIYTISKDSEVVIGFLVDECVIYMPEGNKYINKLIVASCDKKLSKDSKYDALIGNIV